MKAAIVSVPPNSIGKAQVLAQQAADREKVSNCLSVLVVVGLRPGQTSYPNTRPKRPKVSDLKEQSCGIGALSWDWDPSVRGGTLLRRTDVQCSALSETRGLVSSCDGPPHTHSVSVCTSIL